MSDDKLGMIITSRPPASTPDTPEGVLRQIDAIVSDIFAEQKRQSNGLTHIDQKTDKLKVELQTLVGTMARIDANVQGQSAAVARMDKERERWADQISDLRKDFSATDKITRGMAQKVDAITIRFASLESSNAIEHIQMKAKVDEHGRRIDGVEEDTENTGQHLTLTAINKAKELENERKESEQFWQRWLLTGVFGAVGVAIGGALLKLISYLLGGH